MLKNYVVVTVRALVRQRGYSVVNVVGMALGLTCCSVILLFAQGELSFDRYHSRSDDIYRIVSSRPGPHGQVVTRAIAPVPLAPVLVEELPGVEAAVRFARGRDVVSYGDKAFKQRLMFADASVFDVFDWDFVRGDAGALREPFSVVLSESAARRFFGDRDPLGEALTFAKTREYLVTGVVRDVPRNSHFRFEMLCSMSTMEGLGETLLQNWGAQALVHTYVLLSPDLSRGELEARLPALLARHMGGEQGSAAPTLHLQPLTSIHLHSNLDLEIEANGRIAYVYAFCGVGLLVLLIACLNFANLATAQAAGRCREVGVRKSIGAHRSQLARQFLGQAIAVALVGGSLAGLVIYFGIASIQALAGESLVAAEPDWITWSALGALVLLTGFSAGIYPSLYLAGLRPVAALRGTMRAGPRALAFRRVLVTTQLVLAMGLVVGTAVMYAQVRFIQSHSLGFAPEQIVVLPLLNERRELRAKHDEIKDELSRHHGIVSVSATDLAPFATGELFDLRRTPVRAEDSPDGQALDVAINAVDSDYLQTVGVALLAGSLEVSGGPEAAVPVLVNEEAVRQFGWGAPEEAIGRELTMVKRGKGRVVAVVGDFHVQSLRKRVEPTVYPLDPGGLSYHVVRVGTGSLSETLDHMRAVWKRFAPDQPFEYWFVDEAFEQLHRRDARMTGLLGGISGLAVVVTCLGLAALVSFTVERRSKEIGIRKILGASPSGLAALLLKEVTLLAVLAFVLAWPVVQVLVSGWLQGFEYRVDVGAGVFLLGGAVVLVTAWLAVSGQVLRAAFLNPVEVLRYE